MDILNSAPTFQSSSEFIALLGRGSSLEPNQRRSASRAAEREAFSTLTAPEDGASGSIIRLMRRGLEGVSG
jgi:hypothetical protein